MKRLVLYAMTLVLAAASAAAADRTVFTPGAASMLVLDGSSNVTDWRCSGTSLQGELTVAAAVEEIDAVIDRIEDFRLRVPIGTLRCGNAVMERDMNRALKSETHPMIDFRFVELRSGVEHDARTNIYRARIAGRLELAGEQREIELIIVAERVAPNRFRVRAEMPLRMTDFGITPPTALFGMVRARNELVVRFDMTMQVTS